MNLSKEQEKHLQTLQALRYTLETHKRRVNQGLALRWTLSDEAQLQQVKETIDQHYRTQQVA